MHAATLRLSAFPQSHLLPTPSSLRPPSSSQRPTHRAVRALRRQLPTRQSSKLFLRYYDRLLVRHQKIVFTRALAAIHEA